MKVTKKNSFKKQISDRKTELVESTIEYKRFVVLGCGHTGTTLISGILHRSGFWGCDVETHYEPVPLTLICEKILRADGIISDELKNEIKNYFKTLEEQSGGVWTLKDPRLSNVIEILAPFIDQPFKIIFNYRHPANTVKHLLVYGDVGGVSRKENLDYCQSQYVSMNFNVLKFIDDHPDIPSLLVNYDDLVDRKLDHIICRFTGKMMDFSFINPKKRRALPEPIGGAAEACYAKLNARYQQNILNEILYANPVIEVSSLFHKVSSFIAEVSSSYKKIKWRFCDKTLQVPLLWKIKMTIRKRYGWETYAPMRGMTPRQEVMEKE